LGVGVCIPSSWAPIVAAAAGVKIAAGGRAEGLGLDSGEDRDMLAGDEEEMLWLRSCGCSLSFEVGDQDRGRVPRAPRLISVRERHDPFGDMMIGGVPRGVRCAAAQSFEAVQR
jgi:hypothetical protein